MSNLYMVYLIIFATNNQKSNLPAISENVKAALIAASVTIFLGIISNILTIVTTYNNSREKRLLSYGKFYIEYLDLLVPLVLRCDKLKLNLWKKDCRVMLTDKLIEYAHNNAVTFLDSGEKYEIEKIFNILLDIHKLIKNGSYFPMNKKVHRDVVKLEKVIETLIWLSESNVEDSQMNNIKCRIQIPNLAKHIVDIK